MTYSLEAVKINLPVLTQKLKETREVLEKIGEMLKHNNSKDYSIQNLIKKMKMLQLLVGLSKLLMLKMGNKTGSEKETHLKMP